jgi:hypothetical protein
MAKSRPVGGRAGLSKAQAEATKRIKAMTPTQRKAYQAQNKKNAIKVAATAASMIPAGRAAVVGGKAVAKAVAYKKLSNTQRALLAANTPKVDKGVRVNKNANLRARDTAESSSGVSTAKRATGPKNTKDLAKMKTALINNVNSKNLKGKIGKTRASQPSRPLDRNIARGYALRKKFPDKFKP